MKELRFCNEKNSDIRDYQHKVLIQREMEVNGMWIVVNVEKTLSPPPPHAYPGSVPRSLSIYDLFSSPLLAPFFALFRPPFQAPSARFVQRSVPRSVPSFILFIVDKRTLSSIL